MTAVVQPMLCAAMGYFLGTLNPAYLMSRLKGFDIRDRGSGNAGAANAVITMGKGVGALTALLDIAKAYVAVHLGRMLFPALACAAELSGVFAVLGHIFPFTMGFRGGKGLVCLAGIVLAFDPRVFGLMLLAELVLALVTDYICVVPTTACAAFPLVYYLLTGYLPGALIYAMLIPVVFWKHTENFRRIREGKEVHLSFLWNKNKELDRVCDKWESDSYSRDDLP